MMLPLWSVTVTGVITNRSTMEKSALSGGVSCAKAIIENSATSNPTAIALRTMFRPSV